MERTFPQTREAYPPSARPGDAPQRVRAMTMATDTSERPLRLITRVELAEDLNPELKVFQVPFNNLCPPPAPLLDERRAKWARSSRISDKAT